MSESAVVTHKYQRGAEILANAALRFGLHVSEAKVEEWKLLLGCVHELDDFLDSDLPEAQRLEQYNTAVNFVLLGGDCTVPMPTDTARLSQLARDWSDAQRDNFRFVTDTETVLASRKRVAQSAPVLGSLALAEGKMCSRLFMTEPATLAGIEFERWVGDFIAGGTAVDTAVDLEDDYRDGLVKVKPTLPNKAVIASMGVPPLIRVARKLDRKLFKMVIGAAHAVTDDRPNHQRNAA